MWRRRSQTSNHRNLSIRMRRSWLIPLMMLAGAPLLVSHHVHANEPSMEPLALPTADLAVGDVVPFSIVQDLAHRKARELWAT
jgi:hypothetical protein